MLNGYESKGWTSEDGPRILRVTLHLRLYRNGKVSAPMVSLSYDSGGVTGIDEELESRVMDRVVGAVLGMDWREE